MVSVKFINKSGDRIILYQEDGSILKILENGRCWDRDPAGGTLRTTVLHQHETPPPPQPQPRWIDKTEWIYEECPDGSPYAPFKTITFLDRNEVRLKRRLFWKLPEMKWPCVTFLFRSDKMKMIKERLDRDPSSEATIFYNGIPSRKTVDPLSKYASYKRWFFSEERIQNPSYKQIETCELIQYGTNIRSINELEKIAELRIKNEEHNRPI